jgi:hypothetical protein
MGLILLFVAVVCLPCVCLAWCGSCWCVPNDPFHGSCPPPPQNYSNAFVNSLRLQSPTNPYNLLCNPYTNSSCTTTPPQPFINTSIAVCAVKYEDTNCNKYNMRTFMSEEEARQEGFTVSHTQPCGLCSTTQDLASYMAYVYLHSAGFLFVVRLNRFLSPKGFSI